MIPAVAASQLKGSPAEVDWASPFIIADDEAKTLLAGLVDDETLAKEVNDARGSFSTSEERRHPLKGKGKINFIDNSLQERVASTLRDSVCGGGQPYVPEPGNLDDNFQRLAKLLEPDIFATKGQKAHAIVENASLPSLKWTRLGVRQIIIAKFAPLGAHVRSELGGPALRQPLSSLGTIQWLTNCGPEKLSQWVESASPRIFKSSVGPGEILYTPPGWVKLELGNEDAIMVRMSVLPVASLTEFGSDLRIAAADLLAQGKKNMSLEAVLTMLAKEENKREGVADPPALAEAPPVVSTEPRATLAPPSQLVDAPREQTGSLASERPLQPEGGQGQDTGVVTVHDDDNKTGNAEPSEHNKDDQLGKAEGGDGGEKLDEEAAEEHGAKDAVLQEGEGSVKKDVNTEKVTRGKKKSS